jgi:hypothetical protein
LFVVVLALKKNENATVDLNEEVALLMGKIFRLFQFELPASSRAHNLLRGYYMRRQCMNSE